LSPPTRQAGDSLQQFVRLAPVKTEPSPADLELTFGPKPLTLRPGAQGKEARWDVIQPAWLSGVDAAGLGLGNGREVPLGEADGLTLPFPSGAKATPPTKDGVLAVDWNNDHLTDFVLAGAGGLRFFRQEAGGKFKDVTESTKLPPEILKGDYFGAWAADVDL